MSTPKPQATPSDPSRPRPPRRSPSAAGRYLFLFLLGLVIGIVCVVMLLRTLEARKTWQDHYPVAAMQVMAAHRPQNTSEDVFISGRLRSFYLQSREMSAQPCQYLTLTETGIIVNIYSRLN